jgi:hypothetical protein
MMVVHVNILSQRRTLEGPETGPPNFSLNPFAIVLTISPNAVGYICMDCRALPTNRTSNLLEG